MLTRSSIPLIPLAVLASACAATPPARRSSPVATERLVRATATPSRTPEPAVRSPRLEERNIGETAELTPLPEAAAPVPTPPAEQLAAVPPAAAKPPIGTSAEPESLLSRIGPTTPPHVVAALRLIEDGRQQMSQGRYDKALERFERGLAIDPGNAYGYFFLAQLHYVMKKYDQAIAFAGRAVALSARGDPIWLGRAYSLQGAVFENAGRYPDARKAYQKAIEADPNNLAARVGVARLNPNEQQP